MNTETETEGATLVRLPLWKACLDEMRQAGLTYGVQFKAEFFEKRLHLKRDDDNFPWPMMAIKQAIEEEDGFYLRQSENGSIYEIPSAIGHEEEARTFDAKVRRYSARSVNLRSATLENPDAVLTEEERKKIERKLELATWRMLLVSRTKTVVDVLKKHAPKILGDGNEVSGQEAA